MPIEEIRSDNGDKANTLVTLLSFVGEIEANTKVLPMSSPYQVIREIKNTSNIQAIFLVPMTITLPIGGSFQVQT